MASNKNRLQDPVADSLLPLSFLVYLKLKQKVTGVTEELQLITFLFFYLYFLIKNWYKAQRKAKFYINKCRSASCMQGGLKQASA